MKNDFYIYCYFRPNGTPCYIGKGRGGRWKDHLTRATNPRLKRIVAKAETELPHVKLNVGLTAEQANQYEIAWISAIGRGKSGPLVNMTDGGEGATGYNHTPDAKQKIRTAFAGKPLKPEHRAKISRAQIGVPRKNHTTDSKSAISRAMSIRTVSIETREKLRNINLGKTLSDAHREALKRAWKTRAPLSKEARAQCSAKLKGKPWSAARRAAQMEPKTGRRGSPSTINSVTAQTRASMRSGD